MKIRKYIYLFVLLFFIFLISNKNYAKTDKKEIPKNGIVHTCNQSVVSSTLSSFFFPKSQKKDNLYVFSKDLIFIDRPVNSFQNNPPKPKRKFFGKVFSYGLPPPHGLGPCKVGVFKSYYVLGIKISGPKPVMIPIKKKEMILTQEVVPCGTEYPPVPEEEKKTK